MKKTVTVAGLVVSLAAGTAIARAEGGADAMNWHLASIQPSASAASEPVTTGSIAPSSATSKAEAPAAPDKATRRSVALSFVPGERGTYRDMIARHAAANGVPFALADAVVRIESRYNPHARHGGAVGLMQIKPQTARGLGYSGGAAGLLHPETNLRWGMLYLAQAYRMSRGDTCATVMRYQSGHGATRMSGANRVYCSKARTIMASLR
jgi:soluble lytic murein transglycosylase-like protein